MPYTDFKTVSRAVLMGALTPEQFKQAQRDDDYIAHLIRQKKKLKKFIMIDDLLYFKNQFNLKLVLPASLLDIVINAKHFTVFGLHFSRSRIARDIQQRYHVQQRTLTEKLKTLVNNCLICQFNATGEKDQQLLKTDYIYSPRTTWAVDLMPNMPFTKKATESLFWQLTFSLVTSKSAQCQIGEQKPWLKQSEKQSSNRSEYQSSSDPTTNQACGRLTNSSNSYSHWEQNSFPPALDLHGAMAMQKGAYAPSKKVLKNSSCKRNWSINVRQIFHKRPQSVNIRLWILPGRAHVCNPNTASIRSPTVLAKLCLTLRIRQKNLPTCRKNTRKSSTMCKPQERQKPNVQEPISRLQNIRTRTNCGSSPITTGHRPEHVDETQIWWPLHNCVIQRRWSISTNQKSGHRKTNASTFHQYDANQLPPISKSCTNKLRRSSRRHFPNVTRPIHNKIEIAMQSQHWPRWRWFGSNQCKILRWKPTTHSNRFVRQSPHDQHRQEQLHQPTGSSNRQSMTFKKTSGIKSNKQEKMAYTMIPCRHHPVTRLTIASTKMNFSPKQEEIHRPHDHPKCSDDQTTTCPKLYLNTNRPPTNTRTQWKMTQKRFGIWTEFKSETTGSGRRHLWHVPWLVQRIKRPTYIQSKVRHELWRWNHPVIAAAYYNDCPQDKQNIKTLLSQVQQAWWRSNLTKSITTSVYCPTEHFKKINIQAVTTNKQGNTRWTALVLSKLDHLERPLQPKRNSRGHWSPKQSSHQPQQFAFKKWQPREATAAQKKLEQAIAAFTVTQPTASVKWMKDW